MRQLKTTRSIYKCAIAGFLLAGALIVFSTPGFSRGPKPETIEASAMGTGTQLGTVVGVTLNIYDFSTPGDKQILVQAFEKAQSKGLVNALSRMKAVGHVEITGTLGYDCSYIAMIPTATGRKIRFVTNRPLREAEVWTQGQTQYFDLTAGEFNLDATDKSKDTGVLYPAAQLIIDKQGKLQLDLNQNAWKLSDVIDWPGTASVN